MFSASTCSGTKSYNFFSEENHLKWHGIFISSLNLLQKQVHPSLLAKDDALEYIERLIIQLLATLCASEPRDVQDVVDRVQKIFPDPIDKWAIKDADNAIEKLDRKKNKSSYILVLNVDKIHSLLIREVLGYRIDYTVTVYIVAVLEYIAVDILKLTGNYVKNMKHSEITFPDIKVAMCADQVLMDMFSQDETEVSLPLYDEPTRQESLSYENIVKDFILEENQYLHELNMIIKVFRAPFAQHFPSKDLDVIFSNILDIYQFTAKMLSSVEEQLEVAAEDETPTVGICFEDMAEGEEFGVYEKYVVDTMTPNGNQRLNALLKRSDISETLQNYGSGFKDAMKYVLPKLLLGPIHHCLHYFEVIKALIATSPIEEDRESLKQVYGLLTRLRLIVENKFSGNYAKKQPWETSLWLQGRIDRQAVVQKMSELQKSIDGWEGRDIWQSCSEFILDGVLLKHARGKNTKCYVFLFDALIVLCKQNSWCVSVLGLHREFKLKEKFNIRKIDVRDKEDTDDYKNAFEIQAKEHSNPVLLVAKSPDEKSNWMAALISLQIRYWDTNPIKSEANSYESLTTNDSKTPEEVNHVFSGSVPRIPGNRSQSVSSGEMLSSSRDSGKTPIRKSPPIKSIVSSARELNLNTESESKVPLENVKFVQHHHLLSPY